MTNANTQSRLATPNPVRDRSRIDDIVGDVGRPLSGLPLCDDLAHLPGEEGLLTGVANLIRWVRRGNAHLIEQQRRFGPVYRTVFVQYPMVCVSDPEMLATIARNEDGAWSTALAWRAFFEGIDPSVATLDMLVALDFEPHREARKLLQPAFSAAATAGYLETAFPLYERAIEGWIERGRVKFKPAVRRLLANVSSRIFIGIDDDAEGAMLDEALTDFWRAPMSWSKSRWLCPSWRRAMAGHRRLREAFRPRVTERRARGGNDLFSRLCQESRGATWLDDDGLVRLFIGVLAAAFDTTSVGTASMAYLLAKNPEWQERLREEALSVSRRRLAYDDVKRLESTDRAWKETLRLFPVAGELPRRALRDVRLGPWLIPTGTFLLAMIGPVLQDPAWWTHPQRFDPDRFSDARAEDRKHKGLFLPFGGGAHACIGMHLANVEVKAFWHAMLTRCRFRLAPDYGGRHVYGPLGVVSGDVTLKVERL